MQQCFAMFPCMCWARQPSTFSCIVSLPPKCHESWSLALLIYSKLFACWKKGYSQFLIDQMTRMQWRRQVWWQMYCNADVIASFQMIFCKICASRHLPCPKQQAGLWNVVGLLRICKYQLGMVMQVPTKFLQSQNWCIYSPRVFCKRGTHFEWDFVLEILLWGQLSTVKCRDCWSWEIISSWKLDTHRGPQLRLTALFRLLYSQIKVLVVDFVISWCTKQEVYFQFKTVITVIYIFPIEGKTGCLEIYKNLKRSLKMKQSRQNVQSAQIHAQTRSALWIYFHFL